MKTFCDIIQPLNANSGILGSPLSELKILLCNTDFTSAWLSRPHSASLFRDSLAELREDRRKVIARYVTNFVMDVPLAVPLGNLGWLFHSCHISSMQIEMD